MTTNFITRVGISTRRKPWCVSGRQHHMGTRDPEPRAPGKTLKGRLLKGLSDHPMSAVRFSIWGLDHDLTNYNSNNMLNAIHFLEVHSLLRYLFKNQCVVMKL